MLLLYIDPGTGSMLFSFFIGIATAAYFLFRTFLIKAKYLFAGKKDGRGVKNSFVVYSEGLQYSIVFKPILDEFEKRKIPVSYLTSAENDPVLSEQYEFIKAEYIGAGNKAFARLNFLEADICLMTTPGLEVYQLKRSKGTRHYAHILHDVGDATCYRLFGIDWFDSILLSGAYQIADIRELEKIRGIHEKELVVAGSSYLDFYQEKKDKLPKETDHPFTVLVSPSWGQGSLLNAFGEKLLDPLAQLAQTGWRIIVRPHPQSKKSEAATLSKLEERYKDNKNIQWDFDPENIGSLSRADIMISDFSGVIFDFAFLFGKPVLYANSRFNSAMYDAGDLDHSPWKFEAIKEFGVELREEDLPDIKNVIDKAMEDKALQIARENARDKAWQNQGKSASAVVDFMTEKQKSLNS